MAATQGDYTTKAALEMFEKGGNIIDAFVAASFAVSVERPQSTGLGGGGFLVFYHKVENKVLVFDFREVAPLKGHSKMYLNKKGEPQPMLSREGVLAVATPGLVAGLWEIHRKYGRLNWSETVAPSIKLAREGFPLYSHLKEALEYRKKLFFQDPEAREIFYLNNGEVPKAGTIIIQENLAKTLETISTKGRDGFYKGSVAKKILKTISEKNGIMTQKDLNSYKVIQRDPVVADYKGLKIYSMPPPSSGGVHVIQILKMLENYPLKSYGPQTTKSTHLIANAMQRAYLDRAKYLGDSDFVRVPTKELIDDKYLKSMSDEINSAKAISADDLKSLKLPYESDETTHFSLADADGNLVASTQTINGWFGANVIARGTGIILNNEMDDFSQKEGALNLFGAVGGNANLVEPQKRPLSSMSPTIILKNNEPYMALGSPSGTRIITCVAQTILNTVEFEMPLYESVAATRIHQQWKPDKLTVEAPFLSQKVEAELKSLGHNVERGKLGCSIQAIKRDKNTWIGVSDPRGEGHAAGL